MKLHRLLIPGLILVGLLVYTSCRKIDRQADQPVNVNPESRFFKSHRSSDPLEEALVNFIKRENDKNPFIDKVIKQIGYPYWEKGIFVSKRSSVHGRSFSDSSLVVYVPFVRDSQSYVNASMAIRIAPGDTSFRYLCDWQYSNQTFSTTSISDTTAEKFALLFMVLNNNTFGYCNFNITDNRLFHGSNDYSDTADIIERKITLTPAPNSARKSLVASICYYATVYTFSANWHCPHQYPCSNNYCDGCTAVCVDYDVSQHTEVHCFDEEIGGPPLGGGTGGGGGSGGSTPPQCRGGTTRIENVTDPCGPGWIPIDDDPPPPPACDPYISNLSADTAFQNRFKYLNNQTSGTKEYGYAVFDRANRNYQQKEGINYVPHIPWNDVIIPGTQVDGILHNHFLNYNNIFSPDDILLMAELYIKGYVKDTNNFFMGIASNTDAPYLIKVTNPAKFRIFAQKILALEVSNKWFTKTYDEKLRSGDNTKNLKAFFEMLEKHGGLAGLSVYEAVPDAGNYNFDKWKKLNWDGNGDFNASTDCF